MTEEKKNDFLVVTELPQIPLREYQHESGETYDLLTLTEAIKEILIRVRNLEKGMLGAK